MRCALEEVFEGLLLTVDQLVEAVQEDDSKGQDQLIQKWNQAQLIEKWKEVGTARPTSGTELTNVQPLIEAACEDEPHLLVRRAAIADPDATTPLAQLE